MNNNFDKTIQTFWRKIKKSNVLPLSTSCNGRVSSRQVSVIIYKDKFYFQTDEKFLKFKQLSENPNAAFCFKGYSIEGQCKCIGKPGDSKNSFFLELFKKHFYIAYKLYSKNPGERLFEFTPTLIYNWGYENLKPFMEYWDFSNKTYRKEYK